MGCGSGWSRLPPAGSSVEVDTYDSQPDIDFMATVECLRVRRRDGFAEVTDKPPSTAATHSAVDVIAKPETNVVLAVRSRPTPRPRWTRDEAPIGRETAGAGTSEWFRPRSFA